MVDNVKRGALRRHDRDREFAIGFHLAAIKTMNKMLHTKVQLQIHHNNLFHPLKNCALAMVLIGCTSYYGWPLTV